MKIFIVLCESPLKVRKIAIYCFLISVLVLLVWIIWNFEGKN